MAAILTLPLHGLRQLVRGLFLFFGHRLMPIPLVAFSWYMASQEAARGGEPTPVFLMLLVVGVALNRALHWLGGRMGTTFRFSGKVGAAPKDEKPPEPQWVSVAVRRHSTPGHRAIVRQLPRELRGLLQ